MSKHPATITEISDRFNSQHYDEIRSNIAGSVGEVGHRENKKNTSYLGSLFKPSYISKPELSRWCPIVHAGPCETRRQKTDLTKTCLNNQKKCLYTGSCER